MDVPEGTGFGISGATSGERFLMSGAESQKAENLIALFEKLAGRAATDEERADVERGLEKP
jgi:hypothetical protein